MPPLDNITVQKNYAPKLTAFIKAAKNADTHAKQQKSLVLLGKNCWVAREALYLPDIATNPSFFNLTLEYILNLNNTPKNEILSWAGAQHLDPKMYIKILKKRNMFSPSFDEKGRLESGLVISGVIFTDNVVLLNEFIKAGYPADALYFTPPSHPQLHMNLLDHANSADAPLCASLLEHKGVHPLRTDKIPNTFSQLPLDVDESLFKNNRYASMFFDKSCFTDMPERYYVCRIARALSAFKPEYCQTMLLEVLMNNIQIKEFSFVGPLRELSPLQSERWNALLSNVTMNECMSDYFALNNGKVVIAPDSQPAINLLLNMLIMYVISDTSERVHKSTQDFVLMLWNDWLKNTFVEEIHATLPNQFTLLNRTIHLPDLSAFNDALPIPTNDKERAVFCYFKGLFAGDTYPDISPEDFTFE
jgi:hypothetical protein